MTTQAGREAWLYAGESRCNRNDPAPGRALKLVLLGAPGVGKGTQAEYLAEKFSACQLSTGDVFRAAHQCAEEQMSPALETALSSMREGKLVSDETVVDLIGERGHCLNCRYGFMLDGFPRTVNQAKVLDQILLERGLMLDAVINYTLPKDVVIRRLSGRRTCRQCKTTFHLESKPPAVEGVCDKCGGELYQRDDDNAESIRVRLEAYETSTAPVAEHYAAQNVLITVSAEGDPKDIFARTCEALEARVNF